MTRTATILLGLLLLVFPAQAFAYIDPASGTFILQLVIAALAGAVVTVKLYWSKLSEWLQWLTSRAANSKK